MRSQKVLVVCLTIIICFLSILLAWTSWVRRQELKDVAHGKRLVEAMYEFNDILELNDKQNLVRSLVTEDVFKEIGLDYNDNGLNTYLKFEGGPCYVVVEDMGSGYVIYSVENKGVTRTRKFVLFYTVNDAGKIDWVREGELYDFG